MPVSPQDFELYSRMTGAPMPSDAMSRMQMAPDVYKFTKDFARKPNFLEKTGNLAKNIGKGVVFALGAPMVAESMAETERMNEQLRNEGDKAVAQEVTTQEDPLTLQIEKEKNKVKLVQGQAIFFASFLLHKVAPVTSGVRKSLVMWFGGPPLR